MALTPSTMVTLGTPLPHVSLKDTTGIPHPIEDLLRGRQGLLVLFLSNHCPFVLHVQPILGELARALDALDVATVGVHSNDTETHPQDGLEAVRRVATEHDYAAVQLMDPEQRAAKAFRAACTPDAFLYGADGRLVYRGQLDASRPGRGTPTGEDVMAAARAMVAGEPPVEPQQPSTGCNIKWKRGNEPSPTSLL